MAATALLRGAPRLRLHRLATGLLAPIRRSWCSKVDSPQLEEKVKFSYRVPPEILRLRNTPKFTFYQEYLQWRERAEEILRDIEPITYLAKEILHTNRYMDGDQLTAEDEKAVAENLLVYHPHCDDKVGCGLDSIMVDRHTYFKSSRCFFVVRTDGEWIDFSYHKCLQGYIRYKYPTDAERFIEEHFNCGRLMIPTRVIT